ncbi:MAG: hypothetical protein HXX11_09645 [Desulfuromonadales bacterium]|nr:hypothetical protein [Desulfuromonadales bacterium]
MSTQKQVTEEDIREVLDAKPRLSLPFKLALYFSKPVVDRRYGSVWFWRPEDRDKLLSLEPELKKKGVITETVVIGDHMLEGSDNRAVRLAAARAGADAVLIINGVSAVDRFNNALAYSYCLLVTPLVVAGTEADGLFLMNASLWDVRNQYLYLSVDSEGTAKDIKPAVFVNEKRVVLSAKSAARDALVRELASRLARLGAK